MYQVSSTDQSYDRAAKQKGDKFDRSMTRDKLLDNNTTLFNFYFYSNDDQSDQENRRQNRFSERRFSEKKLQTVEWESVAYCSSTEHYRLIMSSSCPLILMGEKTQVILEL